MYTTLALLKASEACVPGYGRMVSFFGTAADIKDQKIPLHVVSLVGGADDCNWALSNATVFEEEEYKAFYRRNFVPAFRAMLSMFGSHHKISKTNSSYRKNPILREFLNEAFRAQTFEECEAFLHKLKMQRFSHWLFDEIADHAAWSSPYGFINFCIENVNREYMNDSPWAFNEDWRGAGVNYKVEFDDEVNRDVEEDEDVEDVSDEDEDDDDHRPRRPVRAAVRVTPARGVPQKKVRKELFWFRTSVSNATKGQNVARLFTDDPYSFIGAMKFKMPKGIKIENKDGQTVMTNTMTDTKNMFALVRMLTDKSQGADQDQSSDD